MTRDVPVDDQRSPAPVDLLSLAERVALVTGAGQGVGRQVALQLAAHGATVVVNDFHLDRAVQVAKEIEALGGSAIGVPADVASFEATGRMIEEATARYGRIDILVNNAGGHGPHPIDPGTAMTPLWETTPEDWRRAIEPNLYGVLNCTRHVLREMVAGGRGGSIVTVISEASRYGDAHLEAYAGAKAGAAGVMRSVARSAGRYGVRANCVAIALTKTDATTELFADAALVRKSLRLYPLGRFGEPTDVANAVLFLASGASSFVTGQVYAVNGGFVFTL